MLSCVDHQWFSLSLQAEQKQLVNEAANTLMDFTKIDDAAAALLTLCGLDKLSSSPVSGSTSPIPSLQPPSAQPLVHGSESSVLLLPPPTQSPAHGSRSPLASLQPSAAEGSGGASPTPMELTRRADSAALEAPHVKCVSMSPASAGKPANDTGINVAHTSGDKAASIKQQASLFRDSNDQDRSERKMQEPHTAHSDTTTSTQLHYPAADSAKPSVGTGAPTAKPQSSNVMKICALLDAPVKTGDPVRRAGISYHNQWQHANATKIVYEMQLQQAKQNRADDPSQILPAGLRPCRTDAEREEYVSSFSKPIVERHQQIRPALLEMMKQLTWQAKQNERPYPFTSVPGKRARVSLHAIPAAKV